MLQKGNLNTLLVGMKIGIAIEKSLWRFFKI